MAEPVEDDISLLGLKSAGHHSPTLALAPPTPDNQFPSAASPRGPDLRPLSSTHRPTLGPSTQPRQDRKYTTARALSGAGAADLSSSSSGSPVVSPRSPNYNIDASGSTYALQVALRNMKERYHKLQKKMALIEDDNQRLISGKSELFGEIGKLQENSIKLREKNLQLNQEIHTKHQECCSLKEKFSTVSTENMSLARQLAQAAQENRRLSRQVIVLNDENQRLREKLSLVAREVKALPGGAALGLTDSPFPPATKTKIVPLLEELDSFDDPPSRFLSSLKDTVDDYEQVTSSEVDGDNESVEGGSGSLGNRGEEERVMASLQSATQRMKDLLAGLQEQNHSLLLLSPLLHSVPFYSSSGSSHYDNVEDNRPHRREGAGSQRDREISALTVSPTLQPGQQQEEEEELEGCQSRLATCGSIINSAAIASGVMHVSPLTHDSGEENEVHVDGVPEDRPRSPFDWRKVEMSDDESRGERPDVRTVSTSPAPGLGEEEEDRICPMCNAVFPRLFPQESFESHVVSHFEVENGFEVIA